MQTAVILLLTLTSTVIVDSHTHHSINDQILRAKELQRSTHQYLNKKCDYTKYEKVMIPFWNDFFRIKNSRADIVTFKFRHAKIYVDFGHENTVVTDVVTWVSLHDPSDKRLQAESVTKVDQRKDEADRCMSGGLMTCDKKTSRCVCMDESHDPDRGDWKTTELVDVATGKPHRGLPDDDPGWADLGCFIKIGTSCGFASFGERSDPFTCVGYNLCNTQLDTCLAPPRE